MAQYDGSIRINTEINIRQASAQLMTLENRIVKTADKIASLRSKMDSLKDAKIPTQEYTAAQKEVDKYSDSLQKAKEKIDKLLETGVDKKSSRFVSAQYDVAQLENKLLDAEEAVKRLEQEGKAFTLGSGTQEYARLGEQMQSARNELEQMNLQHDILNLKRDAAIRKADSEQQKIAAQTAEEQRLAQIKENATAADQELIDLLERSNLVKCQEENKKDFLEEG